MSARRTCIFSLVRPYSRKIPKKGVVVPKKKERPLLPKLSKNVERVMNLTLYHKCPLWYDNFAQNLQVIRDGKDVMELPKFTGKPVVLVGGGPSIWKSGHLDLLEKWRHPIITCDRMLIPLLKRGINPVIVSSVDADPEVTKFYDDPVVDEYKRDVKAVLSAVTVYPDVVKRCPFEKYWFVPLYDDARNPTSLSCAFHFMSKQKTMLAPLGNVGGFNWNLSLTLGFEKIILIGYNYSYDDLDITHAAYYDAYLKSVGGDKEKVKKFFSIQENPFFHNKYLLDVMWKAYREVFAYYVNMVPVTTINASEEGSLHLPEVNVECMRFGDAVKKFN